MPPRLLTMDEYRDKWQPQGWHIIIIGPTSTWRQEWGEWEAIRDIVQNCLDETESYSFGYDDKGLWIADKGKGVAVADFLLGPPKLKPEHFRGRFGEGMKISSLALTRSGYRVYVETTDKELWIVFFEQQVNGRAETLAALWRPNGITTGTKFSIINYFGDSFKNNFSINLPKKAIVSDAPSHIESPIPRKNQIISYTFPTSKIGWSSVGKGKIYCRDIYLRDIDSIYSYNLWGFDLAPDRHGPKNEEDIWIDIGRTWACVESVPLIENFLRMVSEEGLLKSEEGERVSMNSWQMGGPSGIQTTYLDIMKGNISLWQTAWNNVFGSNTVVETTSKLTSMVKHLGYISIRVHYGVQEGIASVVKSDKDLVKESQEKLREVKIIDDTRLNPTQLIHLEFIRKIAKAVSFGITHTYAAIIPPASDRARTAGMYSRTFKEIYISLEQLDRGSTTIDTAIHEIAHHTSGSEDLEVGHADAMTKIAAKVVQYVYSGEYDYIIKNPDFTW